MRLNENYSTENERQEALAKYIEYCRDIIRTQVYSEIAKERWAAPYPTEDAIRTRQLAMIDEKIDHTMRMVAQMLDVSDALNLKINFQQIFESALLVHDIGRFDQATWAVSFPDRDNYSIPVGGFTSARAERWQKNPLSVNHAEAGEIILAERGYRELIVPDRFIPVISNVVLFHQRKDADMPKHYALQIGKDYSAKQINAMFETNIETRATRNFLESLLLQLVRDLDKLDIVYNRAYGPTPPVPEYYFFNRGNHTLESFSKYWGVSPEDILTWNNLNNESEFKEKRAFV